MSDVDTRLLMAVERLGRALRSAQQSLATETGVSVLGLQIAGILDSHPGCRVGELAAALGVRQPTVSDALNALESKGMLQREPSAHDARVVRLRLTGRGEDLAHRCERIMQRSGGSADGSVVGAPGEDRNRHPTRQGIALEVLLEEILRLQQAGLIEVNRSCPSCSHFEHGSSGSNHRCELLGVELRAYELQVDCPDHDPASI